MLVVFLRLLSSSFFSPAVAVCVSVVVGVCVFVATMATRDWVILGMLGGILTSLVLVWSVTLTSTTIICSSAKNAFHAQLQPSSFSLQISFVCVCVSVCLRPGLFF